MEMIKIEENNNEFVNYLTKKLNEDEEKQFCINFSLYLKYGSDNSKFPIDFDIVWKLLGFDKKYNAKRLLKNHFKENIDFKIYLSQSEKPLLLSEDINENDKKINGGQNKETIMLNVITFKKFCLKASTKESDKVIDYYIKLENIFFDYTNDKVMKLSKNYKELQNNIINTSKKSIIKQNKIFKDLYDKKNVVYVMILQEFDNNSFIIKIGHTDDIKNRSTALSCHYGCDDIIIKDVFECQNNNKLEHFLHNNSEITKYKYTELINNKNTSNETYLLSNEEQYLKIKKIIELNINNYNYSNLEELKLQVRIKELQIQEKQLEYHKLLIDNYDKLDRIEQYLNKINNCKIDENIINIIDKGNNNEDINNKINNIKKEDNIIINKEKKTLCELGPYVQCYDPNTKKLIKTFNGITEATREIKNSSYSQIKYAARFNKVYLNYRWVIINNKEDLDKELEDIGEEMYVQIRNKDMIAIINKNGDIEEVFLNQKEVAKKINKSISYICTFIKNEKEINNKKIVLWNNLSEEKRNKYLETNELPIVNEVHLGIKINKIDIETNEVVKTYLSMTELVKENKISPKTIKKAIAKKEEYNGFFWNYV